MNTVKSMQAFKGYWLCFRRHALSFGKIHTYTHTHEHTRACAHACICTHTYTSMYIYTHNTCTHAYTHRHVHMTHALTKVGGFCIAVATALIF